MHVESLEDLTREDDHLHLQRGRTTGDLIHRYCRELLDLDLLGAVNVVGGELISVIISYVVRFAVFQVYAEAGDWLLGRRIHKHPI